MLYITRLYKRYLSFMFQWDKDTLNYGAFRKLVVMCVIQWVKAQLPWFIMPDLENNWPIN